MISHLISLGASPNVCDMLGRTPAMCAADYGHIQVLTLLAEAHADLTGKHLMVSQNNSNPFVCHVI